MPRPFRQLTFDQFQQLLLQFQFTRQIDAVHMHHTWRPTRSMYKGLATIEAMYEFHTRVQGWSDIAQHITIAPDGSIWTGRNWNDPPASAIGYNGNRTHGPFMFEMIADFDKGCDPFDGPQRDATLGVVAALFERFHLSSDSLRFHNQMTNMKSCPGSSLNRDEVLQAVEERRRTISSSVPDRMLSADLSGALNSTGVRELELLTEPTCTGEVLSREALFYASDEGYVLPMSGGRGLLGADFTAQQLSDLRPFVVSMRQGRWDSSGIFNSTPADVDAIFFEHAKKSIGALPKGKKLKFVIYAHGGLVSEQHGLQQAQMHIDWWKQSASEGIYPLYFIWKTGLAETIGQLLGLASTPARDFAARAMITDPLVAAIARRLGGESIWSGMKRDAEQAVLPNGVATYVAQQMKNFCDLYEDRVELHAVGHSAGSVFHAHYIPLSTVTGNPYFTTTSFMAPAVRVDTFLDLLTVDNAGHRVLKPEVGTLTVFTMKKDYERQDDCKGIYHQSLLYLIFHALEPEDQAALLGLEECLRADIDLRGIFVLGNTTSASSEVVWSPSVATSGRSATRAIHHGDFSGDAPSLNSILRRVLNLDDTDPIHEFPGARGFSDIWNTWADPSDLPGFSAAPVSPTSSETPVVITPVVRDGSKRRALCIGIDSYASPNRLTGCVNDAKKWSTVLSQYGFSVAMITDSQATYAGMTEALKELVSTSKSGDVIVFQYSGHGTTVPDTTGRTVDGVEEAMVPVDFNVRNPHLLMDYDIAALFNLLPSGVNLTCFVDCCHSGTITRMLIGAAQQLPGIGRDERPRFITLSPEEIASVQQYRRSFSASARGNTLGGPAKMRDIVFSACRADEIAWEVNGQGDFTRVATQILGNGGRGITNQDFSNQVMTAFGASARQHPMLDCAPEARSRVLLDSLSSASSI